MPHTPSQPTAATAAAHVATYLRCADLQGTVEVLSEPAGYCVGVILAQLSPGALQLVPPLMDGVKVKVLI